MLSEFKAFIARGNVLDLAVAVIIGGAFGKIVTSLTDDVIMPVVALVFGGLNFSSKFFLLADVPEGYEGSLSDYAALKAAGVPVLGYGRSEEHTSELQSLMRISYAVFCLINKT